MAYRTPTKKVAKIRIAGPDRKGIIATITTFLFKNSCNIEDIDQRILEGYLVMNMLVDYSNLQVSESVFIHHLKKEAKKVFCEAEFRPVTSKAIKNIAILVSKEEHCLKDLLDQMKKKKIQGKPVVVIGNHPDLKNLVCKKNLSFHYVPSTNRKEHEAKVLEILKQYDVDLIVLARYMQILSPEFVFRHEGKIINIHPSLLPAFPGPRSYHQAYNKGVEIVGVTAHFATTDLDEGPIIAQDCFKVDKTKDTVEALIKKGKALEAKVLSRAVKLFLEDRLTLRRGKVIDSKKMHSFNQKTKESCYLE